MPHVLYRSGESTPRTTVVLPTPQHYPFLFELALSSGSSFSWRGRRQTMSAFEDVLWEGVYEHAVILDRVSSEPIGYASIGNVNLLHGTAYLSVYVSTELRLRGTPLEGVALLLTRLFERTDLRKVYLESPESAHASFRSSELFEVEAVLEEHLRSGSGFEDLIISSLTRERCDQYLSLIHI